MTTSKQLHHIATNPRAHMRFMTTGRAPETVRPRSPLIDLLEKLSPRDRVAIVGLKVGPALGYTGSRQFASAESALRWMKPDHEMLKDRSWPAESWRDKRFAQAITLDQLIAHAARIPESLKARYPHL